MYSTCLSCHAPLGANEMIEHFPVGTKLAFDQARGRLWAVCAVCRQWNLAGLDERWEAIEEAERLYHDTRLRASTDNIGLARLADGTELVRVGEPQRPEFAAWRYGDRFAARWRFRGPVTAVGTGTVVVLKKVPLFVSFQVAQAMMVPILAIAGLRGVSHWIRTRREVSRVPLGTGITARLTQAHIEQLRVERDPDAPTGWRLRVMHAPPGDSSRPFRKYDPTTVFSGEDATRVATQLLPRVNRTGGRRTTVAEAVSVLERAGNPDAVFRLASRWDPMRKERSPFGRIVYDPDSDESVGEVRLNAPKPFASAPAPVRLAAEMAAHEEQERQLIQGELTTLEEQWREAEEIAAIADSLTLPPGILRQLERLRVR